ncbi:LysR substrate-binding domain-containing protein [Thalassolituus oleivorans]|uniref:HTH lysR-type domain-containing protein n=2 Tax=root TaxID=1 RepID=M5E7P5_9GAMM|nr:LysR substrate-binding domain-containing protein [Thalassolituus oleivorans]AHK17265.1 hypothetical protein R615_02420 [Thalassolituus oleivorans R6-15]MBQ0728119.1 LysR family transcriptional regulator [Thalassolituus oleivorans]MBQ0779380.1 LysR family transcriptional regulator [Thalassolituus oleivorans]MCA6128017.1 hypothetical protein [Thalassolituus oleivorans 4BN06-13]MDF1642527.1 LysR substrate-binding domain-containing protein [Thalassolituus oleivorans]
MIRQLGTNKLPTLNLLRTFEAAGKHLSFKLAAEELCVTPSAVSQQIQLLESQLGVALFERKNRLLLFTSAGAEYWKNVNQQLNNLRDATTQLRQQHGVQRLTVSVMPPVAHQVVFPNLNDFKQQHPDLELHIETGLSYADLQQGTADIAIRYGIPPWHELEHEKLLDVCIQVVCPPGFTQRYQLTQNSKNICDVPRVEMTGRPKSWERWFEQSGSQNDENNSFTGAVFYVDDYPAAIQAAESLGAALALSPIENNLIKSGRLEAPYPPIGPLEEAIYAVYSPARKFDPIVRSFIDWLKVKLAQL